ncbi:hypothetical protein [Hymenobacter aquaticus]|uniref:hypothetical protein n=1 Tax=Hymenobacter aquaticus TaxID=1867101 RepID=UPI0037438F8B
MTRHRRQAYSLGNSPEMPLMLSRTKFLTRSNLAVVSSSSSSFSSLLGRWVSSRAKMLSAMSM